MNTAQTESKRARSFESTLPLIPVELSTLEVEYPHEVRIFTRGDVPNLRVTRESAREWADAAGKFALSNFPSLPPGAWVTTVGSDPKYARQTCAHIRFREENARVEFTEAWKKR